ncbi:hypothetical protein [Oryzihumus leptocrescens]|uniref:hypothetical protein n=1 Tax=Oryzihumus leptocrescens TaxID=297536 RepID=UPI001153C963|nr:hypothetical protein [Oryzihumus leptocrescens]
MQPSSLIFLVIIAIWAAFLLQHWVRRREHLATARSVDRFSDAMRVLERRAPVADVPERTTPAPRSYAVSPTRVVRAATTSASATPAGSETAGAAQPAPRVRPEPVLRPEPTVRSEPTRPARTRHVAGVPARRLRGLSFLGSLVLLVATVPLAGFGVLGWWSSLVAFGLLVADLAWLRRAAQVERAARRAAARHREAAHAPRGLAAPRVEPGLAWAESSARESAAAAAESTVAEPAEPVPADDPDGWRPVPVPPPTYTMKARAAQPPQPAPVPAPATPSTFGGVVASGELDGLLDRRAVGS